MTRFARAKGSKSSNERVADDGTPWEVMKQQLAQAKKESEDNKNREQAEKQRQLNYDNFLKEQKVQKRKSTWCDFPAQPIEKKIRIKETSETQPKNSGHENKKKKKTKSKQASENVNEEAKNNVNEETANVVNPEPKQKQQQDHNSENNSETRHKETKVDINSESPTKLSPISKDKQKQKKKKKGKKVHDNQQKEKNTDVDVHTSQEKIEAEMKNSVPVNNQDKSLNSVSSQNTKPNIKKKNKKAGSKPERRKPVDDRSFQLIINGRDIELERVDGFPIMKKDAERLKELRKNMINRGIPSQEVNRTMKLERRKAEKALARLKREVCYNCRKGGHNLSDCPELKSKIPAVDAAEGVCFKCGSTEHRAYDCKVQKDQNFRFASCFICKEQGHIARQCPDNPKGLYPNGGGCKLCGDVTHLRKDCPTTKDHRQESAIRLDTLDNSNDIEAVSVTNTKPQWENTKKPKKIRF